jgi:hypothetical protein
MPKTSHKLFSVGACIKLWVAIDVGAHSLEDAVAKAKDLKVEDFVDIHGEYNDGSMKIINVYDNNFSTDQD